MEVVKDTVQFSWDTVRGEAEVTRVLVPICKHDAGNYEKVGELAVVQLIIGINVVMKKIAYSIAQNDV